MNNKTKKLATLLGVFSALSMQPPLGNRSGDGQGSRYRDFHFDAYGHLCGFDRKVFTCKTTSEERARVRFGVWQRKNQKK